MNPVRALTALNGALVVGYLYNLISALAAPAAALRADFTVYWTGWWMILHGRGRALYDADAQRAAQQLLMQGAEFEGGLMAFLHPPHAALAGVPFGALAELAGARAAFAVWTALSLLVLARLDRSLRGLMNVDRGPDHWLMTSALLAFYPVFCNLMLGQLSLLLALALVEVHRAQRDGHVKSGAAWLLVLSIKPQLLPPVLVWLAMRRQWRLLAAAGAGGATLALLSSLILGARIWLDYASAVRGLERFFGTGTAAYMPTIRGTLVRIAGGNETPIATGVTIAAWLAAPVALAWLLARRRADMRAELALVTAAALVVSPHLFVQDLIIVAVSLALRTAALRGDGRRWRPFAAFALAWPFLFVLARAADFAGGSGPNLPVDPIFVALTVLTVVCARI